ncbi:hypothetical protein KOW79_012461 [Hemibagrus wyckioides]|uniref:Interleukin-4 n=1 Tax=Hemibagrus wyckioides TaxID=337641 RepID=A0A9D3NLV5_9TELE|nr:hypothetical protein KOW79_012461 [Hemibagrus wyckioides]
MNVFIFVFLSAAVVTAAPHAASTSDKHQHKNGKSVNSTGHECQENSLENRLLLQYIIQKVLYLKNNLTDEMLQKNVFANEKCNCRTLCKAGKVLQAYIASSPGPKIAEDALRNLSRTLLAYSDKCTVTDEQEYIPLRQLLEEILHCGRKEYTKSLN